MDRNFLKIYRPTSNVSTMAGMLFVAFTLVFFLILYGTVNSISFEAQIAGVIDRPFSETVVAVGLLILTVILLCVAMMFGIAIGLTLMAQIHVREDSFRVITWFYQSEWLPWTAICKLRRLPFSSNIQLGIVGLGWMFRVVGLVNWLPGGYVAVGSNLVDGESLIKTIKQKRPDLF